MEELSSPSRELSFVLDCPSEDYSMRIILALTMFAAALGGAHAQEPRTDAGSLDRGSLKGLQCLADKAHSVGNVDNEMSLRERMYERVWADDSPDSKFLDKYEIYNHILFNDLRLGILLEGTHRWADAERVFRHNQSQLARMSIAGPDIRSQNELHLAHLLAREGKNQEAAHICDHWKHRVKPIGDAAVAAAQQSIPSPPFYDTPEVEIAAWDLACGSRDDGLKLLSGQIEAYPHMLVSFTVLSDYGMSEGEFQKARETERRGINAITDQALNITEKTE